MVRLIERKGAKVADGSSIVMVQCTLSTVVEHGVGITCFERELYRTIGQRIQSESESVRMGKWTAEH